MRLPVPGRRIACALAYRRRHAPEYAEVNEHVLPRDLVLSGWVTPAIRPKPPTIRIVRCALQLACLSIADLSFGAVIEYGKGIKMKVSRSFKLSGIAILLIFGLAACDQPGPAETAGKKIDQTADQAGKAIADTTDKVGAKLSEQSAKTGIAIDDAEITAKVKAAIFAEPGLKTLQIGVDTVKGVVTLSGSVDSPSSSDRVKALAASVAGVNAVDNRLATKSN